MKGILSDINIQGHMQVLVRVLEGKEWRDVWRGLNLAIYSFADFGLSPSSADSIIWHVCQKSEISLVTGNRNKAGPDSLEAAIERFNTPSSLPVFTIGDTEQVFQSGSYAERAVVRLLEYLIDIDNYRGTGRLWIP
jgi:hypothetical protein